MEKQLIDETAALLERHIDASTDIRITRDLPYVEPLARLLRDSGLEHERQITILGCYILLHLSVRRHLELDPDAFANAKLARVILDGDYFMGAFYGLLGRRSEMRLFKHLTPVYKRIQLARIVGKPSGRLLDEVFESFVEYINREKERIPAEIGKLLGSTDSSALADAFDAGRHSIAAWIAREHDEAGVHQ